MSWGNAYGTRTWGGGAEAAILDVAVVAPPTVAGTGSVPAVAVPAVVALAGSGSVLTPVGINVVLPTTVAATGSVQASRPQMDNQLVSYWKLDEASGSRIDSVTGTGNDLTTNNTVGQTTGNVSNAAQFARASSRYLSHASNSSLQTGNIDYTFAFWVYFDSLPSAFGGAGTGFSLVTKDTDSPGSSRDYTIDANYDGVNNHIRFYISGGGTGIVTDTTNLSAGTWYYVIAWHDSTAATVNISVNNNAPTSHAHGAVFDVSSAEFEVGGRQYSTNHDYHNGRIDEIGFWKRVLTSAERTRLYNGGSGMSYPFEETATPTTVAGTGHVYGAVLPFRLVQHKFATASTANPTVTFDAAPTEGNLIVCVLRSNANSVPSPAGNPSGYSQRATYQMTTTNGVLRLVDKVAGASESATITWTLATAVFYEIEAYEFAGSAAAGLEFDTSTLGGDFNSTIQQPASITPGVANELMIVASFVISNTVTQSIDSGFTVVDFGSTHQSVHGYKIKTDSTAENPSIQWTPSVRSQALMAAFKPSTTDVVLPPAVIVPVTTVSGAGAVQTAQSAFVGGTLLTSYTNDTGASSYTTSSFTPAANALILACIECTGDTRPLTLTGNGLTWVQVNATGFSGIQTVVFRSMDASPTPGALTVSNMNFGNPSGIGIQVLQFAGVDTSGTNGSGAVVQTALDTFGAGSVSTPQTITLSAFGSYRNASFGWFITCNNAGRTFSPGSGFTSLNTTSRGSAGFLHNTMTEFTSVNDTTVDASWTGGTTQLIAWGVELKGAPEQATPLPTVVGGTGVVATPTNATVARPTTVAGAGIVLATVIAYPVNDDFANAIDIGTSVIGLTTGTNVFATVEAGEPDNSVTGGHHRTVWWKWTAPLGVTAITVNTSGSLDSRFGGSSGLDTTLAVFTGTSVSALTPVVANDDGHGATTFGVNSIVTFIPVVGRTYYFQVGGYGDDDVGSIILRWIVTSQTAAPLFGAMPL